MSDTLTLLNRLFKMAVLAGVETAVKIHINRGDDLNARDSNGLTPLMLAASRNKSEICKLLLEAGADNQLTNPLGMTAHAIAVNVNAIKAAIALEAYLKSSDILSINLIPSFDSRSDNTPEFDLASWEPEEIAEPPKEDLSLSLTSKVNQKAISNHKPIDTSTEWEDIDLYLPESSLRLISKNDEETRDHLRLLLLRAIREGSVPIDAVVKISLLARGAGESETKALLSMIINDLGAEVDERIENFGYFGDTGVFICPEETVIEEDMLDEAFANIDSMASLQNEPLRLYQKDFQKKKLISGEEEISLGQIMEEELERAIDALASWPRGIDHTLLAGKMIQNNQLPLSWFSNGSKEEAEIGIPNVELSDIDTIPNFAEEPIDEELDNDSLLSKENAASFFFDSISRLESLIHDSNRHSRDVDEIRETLATLFLSRRFLMELAELANENICDSAKQYLCAINLYKKANERMAEANLKLVLHLAKKFLYSGEPLDDLVQEGNIGLLKAIDRFDWRLGFKFSTYATWWIRQSISRYIHDKTRTIRVPVHVHESVSRLYREAETFESKTGRSAKAEELASSLNISISKVKLILALPPEASSLDDLDIDKLIAEKSLYDFISPDPFEIVFQAELSREIDNYLTVLDPKQKLIIRLRNGLGEEDALTLEEVGKLHGVTRERIRQIEAKAMRKLKHPPRLEILSLSALGVEYIRKNEAELEYEVVDQ